MTVPVGGSPLLSDEQVRRAQSRTRAVLIAGQVLAGIGMGSTLSAGALLVTQVSGSPAWSGMAATMTTVGAAFASVPLARLARRAGRAPALATGAVTAALGAVVGILAAVLVSLPLLLLALALIGVGTAVNLQSRFAATDLSEPRHRGRDLALVVWATTVGAIAGPNLIAPADAVGIAVGLPELSGPFLFTLAAQAIASVLYLVALRPDPLKMAERLRLERPVSAVVESVADANGVRTGLIALALSHATMVAVMSMTPVHLVAHGATLVVVGVTISLHVAGMYALAPLFGILSDRLGRGRTIAIGQAMLLASLLTTALGAESQAAVVVGLVLLGLGWSAAPVSASALISESAPADRRTVIQGRSDLLMSATGAVGGALAGPVLALVGYAGLALSTLLLVVVVLVALTWRAVRRTPAARN